MHSPTKSVRIFYGTNPHGTDGNAQQPDIVKFTALFAQTEKAFMISF